MKTNNKKILFISPGGPSKATPFISDIQKINFLSCHVIYTKLSVQDYYTNKPSIFIRILSKLRLPFDQYKINKRLIDQVLEDHYDYIFIIKGNLIKPNTLKKIKSVSKNTKLISWSSDDMMQAHNSSYFYLLSLRYYDLVVTTKSFNATPYELKKYGAKKVLFQNNAYLESIHSPIKEDSKILKDDSVLFIGFAEKERFESMNFLARNGIKVDIYGSGWEKNFYQENAHKNLNINTSNVEGHAYSKALSNAFITLCFLRKINRDLQTVRSVEIPACAGLMLAERTEEHIDMFEEGKEAVYFSSNQELLDQINFLKNNPDIRNQIAKNGYDKCLKSKMSYADRLKEILENT